MPPSSDSSLVHGRSLTQVDVDELARLFDGDVEAVPMGEILRRTRRPDDPWRRFHEQAAARGKDVRGYGTLGGPDVLMLVLSAGAGAAAKHVVEALVAWARERAKRVDDPFVVRIYGPEGSVLTEVKVDRRKSDNGPD